MILLWCGNLAETFDTIAYTITVDDISAGAEIDAVHPPPGPVESGGVAGAGLAPVHGAVEPGGTGDLEVHPDAVDVQVVGVDPSALDLERGTHEIELHGVRGAA